MVACPLTFNLHRPPQLCRTSLLAGPGPPSKVKWPSKYDASLASSVGIHTILIGDAQDTDDEIKAMATAGEAPDFVCKRQASCLHRRPVYMPYLH